MACGHSRDSHSGSVRRSTGPATTPLAPPTPPLEEDGAPTWNRTKDRERKSTLAHDEHHRRGPADWIHTVNGRSYDTAPGQGIPGRSHRGAHRRNDRGGRTGAKKPLAHPALNPQVRRIPQRRPLRTRGPRYRSHRPRHPGRQPRRRSQNLLRPPRPAHRRPSTG